MVRAEFTGGVRMMRLVMDAGYRSSPRVPQCEMEQVHRTLKFRHARLKKSHKTCSIGGIDATKDSEELCSGVLGHLSPFPGIPPTTMSISYIAKATTCNRARRLRSCECWASQKQGSRWS